MYDCLKVTNASTDEVRNKKYATISYPNLNKVKIIGTGGITSKESAQSKLDCGADLLQMYTGLVYKGTGLIKEITSNIL